jgi:TrmH family RNA methyltransferase
MEQVASAQNPLIKLVRSLASRKHRQQTGLFIVEGYSHARRAKAHGFIPQLLLLDRDHADDPDLREIAEWAQRSGARMAAVPPALMSRVSGLSNPQALILVCRQRWLPPDVPRDETATVLALDRIRDPGNLGAIIRTAEATAVTRLFLIGDSCDPFSPEAVRASAGSIFAMELTRLPQEGFLQIARTWPGDIVGTHLRAAESFKQSHLRPVLLLMGSESHGLPEELASACTKLVRIPMSESVDSLNIAAAAVLMLYELQLPLLGTPSVKS